MVIKKHWVLRKNCFLKEDKKIKTIPVHHDWLLQYRCLLRRVAFVLAAVVVEFENINCSYLMDLKDPIN